PRDAERVIHHRPSRAVLPASERGGLAEAGRVVPPSAPSVGRARAPEGASVPHPAHRTTASSSAVSIPFNFVFAIALATPSVRAATRAGTTCLAPTTPAAVSLPAATVERISRPPGRAPTSRA